MRLCLRAQDLSACAVAVADKGHLVGQRGHHQCRPEAIWCHLNDDLHSWGVNWSQLTAVAVVRGPGSYTAVRLAVTIAQTISWALGLPLGSIKVPESLPDGDVLARLVKTKVILGRRVSPFYGSPPKITRPRRKRGVLQQGQLHS